MKIAAVWALFKREMMDILRDKKTVAMMILLPIVLYPLLIVAMVFLMNAITTSQEEKVYKVCLDTEPEISRELLTIINEDEEEIGYKLKVLTSHEVEMKLADVKKEESAKEKKQDTEAEEEKDLLTRGLDAKVLNGFIRQKEDGSFDVCYLSAQTDSNIAKNALNDVLGLYREKVRRETLDEEGLDADAFLDAVTFQGHDLSSTEESVGNQIGSLLPFFIITSVLLGAMYPAIDVTAGEKERGTLETLLTLPVTNLEMIMSKFLAVSLIACISAFLNVVSMGGAMMFLVSGAMSGNSEMGISLNYSVFLPGIGFTLLVMVFFAMLVTAICMCTCIFAGSFKEANNYITPVMLVVMFSSYAAMVPNVELTQKTSVIPVVNVALMIKSLFGFTNDYGLYGIVLFTNIAYSLLAVLVLSRLYNSEAVLFSEGFASVHLFSKRSDMKKGQMPGGGDVVLVMSLTLLLMLYIGTFAVAKLGFYGVAVQQGIILLIPLLYAWYIRTDIKKLFSFNMPHPAAFAGGFLMFVGAFILALFVGALLAGVFKESADNLVELNDFLSTQSKPLTVIFIALMPAMGEELLFRGFFMGTIKEKYKPALVIAATAIIFAAYHMSILRFFTVGIIGLSFTMAAYRSRSIFVSMMMHFCNNLAACLVEWYPGRLQKLMELDPAALSSPLAVFGLFGGAAAAVLLGYYLVGFRGKRAAEGGLS
ncbi:MAG: ABC transporter permease [Lachnospiraceae bacterium]|nr:ABC transporter permease [Lachnospiraceae bacterium]